MTDPLKPFADHVTEALAQRDINGVCTISHESALGIVFRFRLDGAANDLAVTVGGIPTPRRSMTDLADFAIRQFTAVAEQAQG